MPSSIRRLTALDHDRMRRLVRRACTPGPSQERWRTELVHLVRAHLQAEAEAITPDAMSAIGAGAEEAGHDVRRLAQQLAERAEALTQVSVGSRDLTRLGLEFQQLLTEHAEVLDRRILLPLEAGVARKEVRRLGGVYAGRRDAALREGGADDPPPRRLDLSRAELYELAKKAGIAGRSAMSRRDLIAELKRRQQTR